MKVLLYGSILFGVAFVIHLSIWKVWLPRRQTKVLLTVFIATFLCGIVVLYGLNAKISLLGMHPPVSKLEYLQLFQYFISLTLAYIITYSAIEADSPSLLIVIKIFEAGSSGLSKETLEHELDNTVLVEPRVNDLLLDGMAKFNKGKYQLRTKGIILARLFAFYRNMMRAGKGG